MAFPKRPPELSWASLEIEGTFSCLSLPLLTGVKGLERSSQKDREGIIKTEGKENDRRSTFFFLMGVSLRVRLSGCVLHRATSLLEVCSNSIHTSLSRRPRGNSKEQPGEGVEMKTDTIEI